MSVSKPFRSAKQLSILVDAYFNSFSNKESGTTKTNEEDPLTFSGLILSIGFNSLREFEQYRSMPRFAAVLDRARLRILNVYEKKLQTQFSGGAKYALEKLLEQKIDETPDGKENDNVLQVEVLHSHLKPVSSESEVVL